MTEPAPLSAREILRTWWPLAASWLLMGIEMPMVAAFLGQMPGSKPDLAALGGVVFPLSLLVEAPIIMLLAASTALVRDAASHRLLLRFSTLLAAACTVVHAGIAFSPLFDVIAERVLAVPDPVVEPARLGMQIMTPWTWAIADRRFHQGVLIRFGRQRLVGVGTVTRLLGTGGALAFAQLRPWGSPIAVGASALVAGVIVEAIFVRLAARPVVRGPLRGAATPEVPLDLRRLLLFYVPLAMTPLISIAGQPIGAGGLARMPLAFASLAAWPALNGFGFMLRSIGISFNEVVVRHAGDPGAERMLRRFAWIAGGVLVAIVLVIAVTPIGRWWFGVVNELGSESAAVAIAALPWAAPLPLLSFLHSYWQGLLVNDRRTRPITESVVVSLATTTLVIAAGVAWSPMSGAASVTLALVLGSAAQAAWLAFRRRAGRA